MILFGDRVVCSTGDLVQAARCEFALLRALDAELGLVGPAASGIDIGPLPARLLDELRERFGGEPRRIDPVEPGSPAATLAALTHSQEQTLSAVRAGADLIAGPIFFDGSFAAGCTALIRTPAQPTLPATPEPVDELASPADRLHRPGGGEPPERTPVSEGQRSLFPLDESSYEQVIDGDALKTSTTGQDGWAAARAAHPPPPTPAQTPPDERLAPAPETTYQLYAETDEPVVVTLIRLAACAEALQRNGFGVHQLVRIRTAGGETHHDLCDAMTVARARRRRVAAIVEAKQDELLPVQWGDRRYLACGHCPTCTAELVAGRDLLLVAGMRPAVRAQLHAAGITTVDRLARADSAVSGIAAQTFSLLHRQAALQLRRERTGQPVCAVTDATALAALPATTPGDVFLTLAGTPPTVVGVGVAPTRAPEEGDPPAILFHAFDIAHDPAALLEFLADRQERHPELRIHHYRSPARELLAELCARCGVDSEIADDLLGALLDLYPIVRAALMIGERSYRLADLTALLDEVPEFACDPVESECALLLAVRDRLRALADEHGVRPRPAPRDSVPETPSAVEAALREFAYDTDEPRTPAQDIAALTAAVLAYHRRERQPLHWAHADRLHRPIDEWADTPGVLVADWGSVDTKWHSTGQRPMRRYLKLTGRLGTGSAPPPGTPVLTLYERPVPGMTAAPGRRAVAAATVLGCARDDEFDDVVRVEELLPEGCAPYDDLPVAIVPRPPGSDENIAAALEFTANQLLGTLPEAPLTGAFDLLCRRRPRLRSGDSLPEVFGDHAAAVTAAVLDLDDSYIAVQGPPGTGKTDTGARVIERLVTRHRWRIGVVAQSHSAVEEVLDAVVRAGVLPELVAKSDAQEVAPEWLVIDPARYPRFLDNAVNGCVVGGLPGDVADPERIPPGALDLLVLPDAGHFPLADAIAVAGSARNLLLLGDPAPLPTHGIHPEPVAESALGRLVGESSTLPPDFGYFLDRTWRMHPQLCGPVSRLRYGDRLRSNETVTLARELADIPPGVRMVPVEHRGNGTESVEEAREVVRQVRALLGLPWRQGAVMRKLHPHDILVVAPYHAQVARIRTLLSRARIEDVVVGTTERFQGREAAVVLVSTTTSTPADAPHGIEALLSRHWLTTAVSRAMWAAVIVHSGLLTEYLPETPGELADLAAFLHLANP
ncbi:AAA domain-containing protein [Nocardia sp. CDC159]|uniref:AAA domain-containing protein n=1 Tax=Nocardia pulmonis TaxID=2951408 RepID=A0A9X2E8U8_9NOCA|nr:MULTISPECIES: AAA domain-containing protein [Nocardia]MCM6775791.1 AAA domain-containing protein [Nocardia pulmonis]MCM6788233.1 AAA domain-containing protein [Nocardia sp. CDC159]